MAQFTVRDRGEKDKEESSSRSGAVPEEAEFPNKRRNMILAAIFALTAMVGYSMMNGLIQVQVLDYKTQEPQQNNKNNSNSPDFDSKPHLPDFDAPFEPLFEEQNNENQQ